MQVSGKGAGFGFLFDMVSSTFPLGTIAGSLVKNVLNFDAGDMNKAYDAKASTKNADFDFGDLKGMARGLMGKLDKWVEGMSAKDAPSSNESAMSLAKPRVDADAGKEAQQKSSFGGWGKVLLWGGIALAGLSLLNNIPFFGHCGMPFYGAGMGFNPLMMGGVLW